MASGNRTPNAECRIPCNKAKGVLQEIYPYKQQFYPTSGKGSIRGSLLQSTRSTGLSPAAWPKCQRTAVSQGIHGRDAHPATGFAEPQGEALGRRMGRSPPGSAAPTPRARGRFRPVVRRKKNRPPPLGPCFPPPMPYNTQRTKRRIAEDRLQRPLPKSRLPAGTKPAAEREERTSGLGREGSP